MPSHGSVVLDCPFADKDEAKALGVPPTAPTLLLTDNLANKQVAERAQSAARSRHFLDRQVALHERQREGALRVAYVPDPQNPADVLTKFLPEPKRATCVRYATGSE